MVSLTSHSPRGDRGRTFDREFLKLRGPWRAALALALHIGFFALPFALVFGLLSVAALTVRYDTGSGLRAGVAALVVTAVLGVGLWTVLRPRTRPRGVTLTRSAQPQLWRMLDSAASAVSSPAPDEVRVTIEPGTGIREDTRLLGLRTRARYLEIGLPLLAVLTISELRAVVAGELGRNAGQGKLNALACRTGAAVERTAELMTGGPAKWWFTGYARLYAKLVAPIRHDATFHADEAAVHVGGRRAAITALRKTTAIGFGWSEYATEYLSMATKVERTPDVLLGFRAFMENPERKPDLIERAKNADDSADGATAKQRIDAMKRMPVKDRESEERPAFAVLRNPRKSVPALEDQLMVDGLGPREPWPELARLAGAAHAEQQAGTLSSAVSQSGLDVDPALGGLLQAIHQERGPDLINPVLNPGLDPERVPTAAIDTLTDLLGATVVDALVTAGRAHHELNWAGPSVVKLADGRPLDPDRLVRPAVEDPRLVPGLHRTLVELGVPLHHVRNPADDPEPTLAGVVSPVMFAGDTFDLLVSDRGLLLVPSASSTARRLLAGALARARRAEIEELAELEQTPISELRERSDAQWVDTRDVASANLVQERSGWSLTLELYLDDYATSSLSSAAVNHGDDDVATTRIGSTPDSEERGNPYSGLGDLMGARMRIDDHRDDSDE